MMIYIKRSDAVYGPYSIDEVRGYLSIGRLVASDFAQLEGTSEWIPLTSVPGIRIELPPRAIRMDKPLYSGKGVNIWTVVRDVLIINMLTFIGGVIVVLASDQPGFSSPRYVLGLAAANILFGTVGFIIVGYLAKGNRWRHLAYVAIGAWLFGLVNVFFGPANFIQWFFSVFSIGIMMVVGGGLSFEINKR